MLLKLSNYEEERCMEKAIFEMIADCVSAKTVLALYQSRIFWPWTMDSIWAKLV